MRSSQLQLLLTQSPITIDDDESSDAHFAAFDTENNNININSNNDNNDNTNSNTTNSNNINNDMNNDSFYSPVRSPSSNRRRYHSFLRRSSS